MAQATGDWGVMQQEAHLSEGTLAGTSDVATVLPTVPNTMATGGYNTTKLDKRVPVVVNGCTNNSTLVAIRAAFPSVSEKLTKRMGLIHDAVPSSTTYIMSKGESGTSTLALAEAQVVLAGNLYKAKLGVTANVSCDVLLGMDVQRQRPRFGSPAVHWF